MINKLKVSLVGVYYTKQTPLCLKIAKRLFHFRKRVDLIPDPTNTYDSDAIQVQYKSKILGYIARDQTHKIHTAIKKGYRFKAYLVYMGSEKYQQQGIIKVKIFDNSPYLAHLISIFSN